MKLRSALLATLPLLVIVIAVSGAGCSHKKQYDWRSPSPPTPCATDADCRGGTCIMEPDATHGSCSGAAVLPLLPQPDGGPAPPGQAPGPNVQPSPSDIQI